LFDQQSKYLSVFNAGQQKAFLFNATGQLNEVYAITTNTNIDLSRIKSGLYILSIGTSTFKIFIE